VADVNVFDPDAIAPAMPTIVHDLPAGEPRILQKADGIAATLVGGQIVLRDGEHTGALPGTLIRGPLTRRG
jgi:N-acyl-D-aspartate/D-glutamate deacylase